MFVSDRFENKIDLQEVIKHIVADILDPYKFRGSLYVKRLSQNTARLHSLSTDKDRLANILEIVAAAHYENFELGLTPLSTMTLAQR